MNAACSIIVVTHDSADDLAVLVRSLGRHLGDEHQLVVVDTGSRDDSLMIARRAGADVVELPDNPGFGAANNAGLELASAPVTALLNPDIELLDAGLERLVARALQTAALVVPRLIGGDGRVQKTAHPVPGRLEALGFALLGPALPDSLRLRAEPWRSDAPRVVGWAIAAALAARTDLLHALGPFDPSAFLFYEDLDLCLRARARGIPTLLEPDVVLGHRGAHSTDPSYRGEPYGVLARRRREVVRERLGTGALALDDLAQGMTFATRAAAWRITGRSPERPRAQLAALRAARSGDGRH